MGVGHRISCNSAAFFYFCRDDDYVCQGRRNARVVDSFVVSMVT